MTFYAPKINSPATTLNGGITDSATTITVVDATVFPSAPNLATIGLGEDAETILYTGISINDLTGITRAFEGTAKAWDSGTPIIRVLTAHDISSLQAYGIEDIGSNANGEYIKYADGTLECWHTFQFSGSTGVYTQTWTPPVTPTGTVYLWAHHQVNTSSEVVALGMSTAFINFSSGNPVLVVDSGGNTQVVNVSVHLKSTWN